MTGRHGRHCAQFCGWRNTILLTVEKFSATVLCMTIRSEAKELEVRVVQAGLSMRQVLKKAGVSGETWRRWKNGPIEPQMRKWRAVETAFEKLERST